MGLLALSQVGVAWLWWRSGWTVGLPAMMATHLLVVWATLYPRATVFCPALSRLPTDERVVWLTIDDGPSGDTAAMLDLLDRHGAKATFFLVGERALAQPAVVQAIRDRGHGIGNHSADHPDTRFWRLGPGALEDEIGRNGWLTVDADPAVIFDTPIEQRYARAVALLGIDPPRYQRIIPLADDLIAGQFTVGAGHAVIGKELARDLGLGIGDKLRLDAGDVGDGRLWREPRRGGVV